ncbi:hypothetical protein DICVIV_06037 [Dictyocaulus viviparus]|uniref:Actin interacting protein 3-like C-terminal domain-containing protein n=1 Tax=Dictyocaulus viviparus TaxID=29172 RepID=A0A0D8XVK3_DICVI|nr:hypothetical protein DICVIV_06037 [Dictyocaulus viviparus]
MPVILSWKNRILGRKTPEPEKTKYATIVKEPIRGDLNNEASRRNVRFNEVRNGFGQHNVSEWQNEYGEGCVIGSVKHTNNNGESNYKNQSSKWKYADSSASRMSNVPLATSEFADDESLGERHSPTVQSKASTLLQHIRDQNNHRHLNESVQSATLPPTGTRSATPVAGITSQFGVSLNDRREVNRKDQPLNGESTSMKRQLDQMNVVFLQANDEVKRAILPPDVRSLEQVKMAFIRAFPNIPRHYIEQPAVKIYIQEASKGQLFYELEDPDDIKNKSVLKLRDHSNTGMQSPIRFFDHPDYLSECDNDSSRQRFFSVGRPASAMAHSDYRKYSQKAYDVYESYGSEASSHDSRSVTRSGSATPVIDKESRIRMEAMERQLAGLSSLVHSALVSKGMNESSKRDMAELRKEILALHMDSERAASEEPPSLPDSISSQAQQQLDHIRQKLQQASADMKQLRRIAQVNAQHARNYINEAAEQIIKLINQKIAPSVETKEILKANDTNSCSLKKENTIEEQKSRARLLQLLESLTNFENDVEKVRNSVLNSNRKLRMSEVESLTESLTQIGKEAAALKSDFPSIQVGIETRIKADMEKIVKEEKYIRDQTNAIDQSLRRCKALANIMVTMKKLAMIQDPALQRNKKSEPTNAMVIPSSSPLHPVPSSPTSPILQANSNLQNADSLSTINGDHIENNSSSTTPLTKNQDSEIAAPLTSAIPNNAILTSRAQQFPDKSLPVQLDIVLEEVTAGGAPPPPNRFSVQDVHQKFQKPPQLPEQIKKVLEDQTRRSSPTFEASERRYLLIITILFLRFESYCNKA